MNARRKQTANLSLDGTLLVEAKELKINLSRAAEHGVREAVAQARAERWKKENATALASSNAYVEKHGLPLAHFRQF